MRRFAIIVLISFASAQMPTGGAAPQAAAPTVPPELQPVWDKYEELISDYPDEPLLHYNFGNLAYGTGDYAKALEEYKTALSSEDRLAQSRVYYNLGNSLYRAGQLEAARDFFRKALQLNPADSDARTNYELASLQAAEQEQKDTPASDPDAEDEQTDSSEEGEQREGDQGEGENEEQQQSESDQSGEQDEQQESGQQSKDQQAQSDPVKQEEAEAILNALKANEDNLLKRQYKPAKPTKLEKDW